MSTSGYASATSTGRNDHTIALTGLLLSFDDGLYDRQESGIERQLVSKQKVLPEDAKTLAHHLLGAVVVELEAFHRGPGLLISHAYEFFDADDAEAIFDEFASMRHRFRKVSGEEFTGDERSKVIHGREVDILAVSGGRSGFSPLLGRSDEYYFGLFCVGVRIR